MVARVQLSWLCLQFRRKKGVAKRRAKIDVGLFCEIADSFVFYATDHTFNKAFNLLLRCLDNVSIPAGAERAQSSLVDCLVLLLEKHSNQATNTTAR